MQDGTQLVALGWLPRYATALSIVARSRSVLGPSAVAASAVPMSGLEEFSHLEIVFRFHLTDPTDLNLGARRPRDNRNWPSVGIFGHRNMRRINWLGVSRCRLVKVDGLDLHVEDLDAVDGTPVLDIKPWFTEMGPRGELKQATWSHEMLRLYYASPPTE